MTYKMIKGVITFAIGVLLVSGCTEENKDALDYKAHYATAYGVLVIDSSNETVGTSTPMVYEDDDIYDGLEAEISDHIILENSLKTVKIELSKDCKSISILTYKDDLNITYDDFTGITFSCIEVPTDSAVYDAYKETVGDWDYNLTTYALSFDGSLTNSTNDTVQITDDSTYPIEILEVEYMYGF